MAAAAEPKIFKKVEVVEGGGHHGGGWKVAYADFMTAMMAFFLLMWILASSDEQQLRGIAEYFTDATQPGGSGVLDGATLGPPGTLSASNGSVVARGSELGKIDDPSPAKWEVRDTTPTADPKEKVIGTNVGQHENPAAADQEIPYKTAPNEGQEGQGQGAATGESNAAGAGQSDNGPSQGASPAESDVEAEYPVDDMKFKELQEEIMQAMQNNPELDALKQNVIFEETPEGLHIQIIDQEGKPMFRSGRAEMLGPTQELLGKLGQSLSELPNKIVLSGHTDSVPFANSAKYDNWDLSTDRANATRRVFEATGVDRSRIIRVSGMADTDPLVPENPKDPTNRRISILVQYRTDVPQEMEKPVEEAVIEKPEAEAMPAPMQKAEKPQMSETPKPSMDMSDNVQHAADHSGDKVQSLNDEVFQNLRNALR